MGGARIRMRDVAEAAGVSVMTVSRALREDSRVARDTRDRVLSIVRDLDYAPDEIARSLSSKRSGFVAALVPSLNNPHFADTVRALAESLEARGLQVLIGHTNYEPAREERLVAELLRRRPEALAVTVDGHTAATRALLGRSGIPIVEMWDWPDDPIDRVVGFSNRDAARDMVRYLASRGYRRIAFVGESDDRGTRGARRREGYLEGLGEAGLGPPRLIAPAPPPISMMDGRTALRAVRERWPETDAVMCVSDPCAFGVLTEARAVGLLVPDDLGVAGFGDFEVSRCCEPGLTTVTMDSSDIGRTVGEMIVDVLSSPASETHAIAERVRVRHEVAARASTR